MVCFRKTTVEKKSKKRRIYYDNATVHESRKILFFQVPPKALWNKYEYFFDSINPRSNLKNPNDFDFLDKVES
jgi:hypothetical protein